MRVETVLMRCNEINRWAMDSRCGDLGYVATELHPGTDNNEFESFYNFSSTDGKKLAQLTSQSRFPGDFPRYLSGRGGEHVMDMRQGGFTTSVSVEESDFLEEFMACDFTEAGGRDRSTASSLGSMTDLSLAEVDNLPRAGPHTLTSEGSGVSGPSPLVTPGSGHKFPSYDQEQENRFPGTHRRLNSPAYGKPILISQPAYCLPQTLDPDTTCSSHELIWKLVIVSYFYVKLPKWSSSIFLLTMRRKWKRKIFYCRDTTRVVGNCWGWCLCSVSRGPILITPQSRSRI